VFIMNIRPLEKSDKEQMLKLMKEFWIDEKRGRVQTDGLTKFEELKNPLDTMKTEFEQYLNWIGFIAEENNEIIGFAIGRIKEKDHKVIDKEGYLEEFFVTEQMRGKGIGKKLFDKIVEEFKREGCKSIGTDAYATNTKALKYYRKLGFKQRIVKLVRDI
jgi:ribosomal protein S18 acetylase RimI-like enzyme